MQYNYDFHLHHQLVDASQMLQELEIFYDKQMSTVLMEWPQEYRQNGILNFFCGPHLLWCIL